MKEIRVKSRTRLLALIWPFVAVVLAQALIASASLYTLSTVRAYVVGESLWSKGQKDAIYFLSLYADTGEVKYFQQYKSAIAIPFADRDARLALDQSDPDKAAARLGFKGGGNHPKDIPSLIWLFQNFRNVSYLSTAIDRWVEADPSIFKLAALGESIRAERSAGFVGSDRVVQWKRQIYHINEDITPLAMAFSESLGEGSRAIKDLLLALNILTAAMLILLAVWRTGKLLDQRHSFESALNAERERAQITLASIGEAVITTDATGRLNYMNKAAEQLLGWKIEQAGGNMLHALFQIVVDGTNEETGSLIERILSGEEVAASACTRTLVRTDGTSVPVAMVGAPLHVDQRVAGAVVVFHDMTVEQEYVTRLSWQASHDALTSLANRREFESRLQNALDHLAEQAAVHSLMYLDLDQFKIVNDTCGHAAGDELLRMVSNVLQHNLRPGDLLARLGGDEFGILMENCTPEFAAVTAEVLRQSVQDLNFAWNGRPFSISVSVGLVSLSESDTTLEETLRGVDVACYMAKEKGRNRVQLHQRGDSETLLRFGEMAWVQRIHQAIDEHRFCLYAQEIAPLRADGASGAHVELLLRLKDSDGKLVLPGVFIPAAERYGLMPMIDRWVVRNAFEILATQADMRNSAPIETCAINLSGASFSDETFIDYVQEQFARYGISPKRICFEITETNAIANLACATSFITALQAIGCRFSLDDFGSGMSSFAYLKHLPVDYLKIDGGFVKDMLNDRIDRAMVEMIHHIGKVTGKKVVAEFVESDEIAAALRDIGVDYAQGYAIARPKPFLSPYVAEPDLKRHSAAVVTASIWPALAKQRKQAR